MEIPKINNTLKKLRHHYRLVIMNEDTFEEVLKFKLTRMSVYIAMSSIFILLVGFTSALFVFTPLKYYLPGTGVGNTKQVREYRALKIRADSLEKNMKIEHEYLLNIQKVLKGETLPRDTNTLHLPTNDTIAD
jgi:hypothetical protein